MKDQIIETWFINNRINLYLIGQKCNEGMDFTLSKRGGKTVAQQFAHLHNLRMGWLEIFDKNFARTLKKIEKEDSNQKSLLKKSFEASRNALSEFFKNEIENEGKIKIQKRSCSANWLFISHDAHHHGNFLLTLK